MSNSQFILKNLFCCQLSNNLEGPSTCHQLVVWCSTAGEDVIWKLDMLQGDLPHRLLVQVLWAKSYHFTPLPVRCTHLALYIPFLLQRARSTSIYMAVTAIS